MHRKISRSCQFLLSKKALAVLLTIVLSSLIVTVSHAASLTIAAAADLNGALSEIGRLFEKKTGIAPVFNFGSSGMLAMQVENGAPFDLFFSADRQFVERLKAGGIVVADSVKPYAVGRIGITTKKGAGITVRTMSDLAAPSVKKIAIANPDHAPYGRAAKEALESAGLWDKVKPRLVYGENIRQTLQFVSSGNADAGIVAFSLHDPKEREFVLIDAKLHKPLVQAVGIVSSSPNKHAARLFAEFIFAEEGQEVMRRYGFERP